MKIQSLSCRLLAVASLLSFCASCSSSSSGGGAVTLKGKGATFPAPLYLKWFKTYSDAHPDVEVDYDSAGSGPGITALTDKTVDFGASDVAMTPEEIGKVDGGVQLLPMTAGAIVLAYHLDGVDSLQLSREAYVGIFLGKVKKWNDPLIAKDNKDAKLPNDDIIVVVRAEGSGTTQVFTKHLSAISKEFAASPGENKQPNWTVGSKSKGNEGVAASIKSTPNSIGYIEFGYAVQSKMKMAKLENKAGKFVEPTIASAQATLGKVSLPENLVAWLPDPEGDDSYPIVTFTWIMAYKQYAEPAKAKSLRSVLAWCLADGQKMSEKLGYVPLPDEVVAKVKPALDNIQAKK
jgi:phosphate transport system substrate-binding protein